MSGSGREEDQHCNVLRDVSQTGKLAGSQAAGRRRRGVGGKAG
jgi:hypothetical protein